MTTITFGDVNADVLRTLERPKPAYFLILIAFITALLIGALSWAVQIDVGMGLSGINHPIGWGVYITNFVFWIGIGHAGTLISAVFFLTRAPWRAPVYRAAEAMTVFAVMTAGLFPLLHVGRVWYAYWLIPYPTERLLWVNFKSPLLWDVFAVSTYLTISITFFVVGLIPDISAMRDNSRGLRKIIYTALAVGWNNSFQQWLHYMRGYLLLAAFATPLVFSVHSIVSWDFAMSLLPGWHTTIFAPYFVAGAIYSGVGMVFTLLIPLRKVLHLEHMITVYHLENLAKLTLFTGSILFYAYAIEYFVAWYSGVPAEQTTFYLRAFGPMWWAGWTMIICNAFVSQLFWFKKIRTNITALFILSIFINIGMWFERFVIIVGSLGNDHIPFAWGQLNPNWADWGILAGSFGWFLMYFLLFARTFPIVAIQEIKEMIPMPRKRTGGHR